VKIGLEICISFHCSGSYFLLHRHLPTTLNLILKTEHFNVPNF